MTKALDHQHEGDRDGGQQQCQHAETCRDVRDHPLTSQGIEQLPASEKESFVNAVARRNVSRAVESMLQQSQTLDGLARDGRIEVIGAMYDVVTGDIEFLTDAGSNQVQTSEPV